jgi:hypothetical protein
LSILTLSGTGRRAAPPIGGRHCRHLSLTMSSTSPSFSTQIASAHHFPSSYQCSRRRPPPPPTIAAHRRCPAPPPPPCHRAAASVHPSRYHLAPRFPPVALELPPPVPPHLVARLDVGDRATMGVPCTVTTRCTRRAVLTDRLGRFSALGRYVEQATTPQHYGLGPGSKQATAPRHCGLGRFQPNTVLGFKIIFLLF